MGKKIDTIKVSISYISDLTRTLPHYFRAKKDTLLLESAEIDSKKYLKSLFLIDTAVKIVCHGPKVTYYALTDNGEHLIDIVKSNIPPNVKLQSQNNKLELLFDDLSIKEQSQIDEDSKLKMTSTLDAIRLVQNSFDLSSSDEFDLFFGGLFSYDLVGQFESLGQIEENDLTCPDYIFYIPETLLINDHQNETSSIIGSCFSENEDCRKSIQLKIKNIIKDSCSYAKEHDPYFVSSFEIETSFSDNEFCEIVSQLKKNIVAGDIFQVVPSRKFTLPCPSPLKAYQYLKKINPAPYMFYMNDNDFTLFGASPETAVKYSRETNQVEVYPIAGTRRRGVNSAGEIDQDLDERIELELRTDSKELAEHMMLVDLARNDVARISKPGTRKVADLLRVDRYSQVMHLVSRVVGELRDDLDGLHAYQACMNMGTLTGAPKLKAMELIYKYEKKKRGSYGGGIGYITGRGTLDTCIVIRSAWVEKGIAHIQAGGGIVLDSIPMMEADETRAKAQAIISAIREAHTAERSL